MDQLGAREIHGNGGMQRPIEGRLRDGILGRRLLFIFGEISFGLAKTFWLDEANQNATLSEGEELIMERTNQNVALIEGEELVMERTNQNVAFSEGEELTMARTNQSSVWQRPSVYRGSKVAA